MVRRLKNRVKKKHQPSNRSEAQIDYTSYYVTRISVEIWLHILKYTTFQEVLNFCEAFKYLEPFMLQQRIIISKGLHLAQNYRLNFVDFMGKINAFFVTYVNLNHCHWISGNILRKCISRLTNLKTLSALRTQLGLSNADLMAYKNTKIDKLAVTVISFKFNRRVITLDSLTTLCLQMYGEEREMEAFLPPDFMGLFPNLEKFWLQYTKWPNRTYYAEDVLPIRFFRWYLDMKMMHLKKLYLSSNIKFVALLRLPVYRAKLFFVSEHRNSDYVICFEQFDRPVLDRLSHLPTAWAKCINIVGCRPPWSPKDGRLLLTGRKQVYDIVFEEMNCDHDPATCRNQGFALNRVLKVANARFVKRLTLQNCGLKASIGIDRANSILKRFIQVEHLEIYVCNNIWGLPGCCLIANYVNLKSLYIEIPSLCDGHFLINVLSECKHLEKLRVAAVNMVDVNQGLNENLLEALQHSSSLKELVYFNMKLPELTRLLPVLDKLKLRKLGMMCDYQSEFEEKDLRNFLQNNPQLLYFFFEVIMEDCIISEKIQAVFDDCKQAHNVFVTKLVDGQVSMLDIREISLYSSQTCNLRLEDDFDYF